MPITTIFVWSTCYVSISAVWIIFFKRDVKQRGFRVDPRLSSRLSPQVACQTEGQTGFSNTTLKAPVECGDTGSWTHSVPKPSSGLSGRQGWAFFLMLDANPTDAPRMEDDGGRAIAAWRFWQPGALTPSANINVRYVIFSDPSP